MKPETKTHLDEARRYLGKCAAKVSSRETSARPLSASEKEMVIGFGTARDWIVWASALEDLSFSTKATRNSARSQGITESVRFNQMWTATNALFAKDSILICALSPFLLTNTVTKSELKRFEVLYKFASIDTQTEARCLDGINALLSMECQAEGVPAEFKADGTPTMWEVIYHKYLRPEDRARKSGIGNTITLKLNAAKNLNVGVTKKNRIDHALPAGDGPSLIYAARNWAVHGVLLTTFFRGSRQKYVTFIDNITMLLSMALAGMARNLHAKL
jgi:hypothetical protein